MKSVFVLLVGVLAALCGPLSAVASEKPRIGYLALGRSVPPALFVQKMNEAGYIDGQTAAFEYRFAEGQHELLPPLARELVDSKVDVLFAVGDEAIQAAQSVTKTIPIVMFSCDAVSSGFVASLDKPGGNTTGVSCITADLSAKRVQIFREALPQLRRLAVLYNPLNKSKPNDFTQTRDAANSLGISVQGFEVTEPEHIRRAFAGFERDQPDGISVLDEGFTILNAKFDHRTVAQTQSCDYAFVSGTR